MVLKMSYCFTAISLTLVKCSQMQQLLAQPAAKDTPHIHIWSSSGHLLINKKKKKIKILSTIFSELYKLSRLWSMCTYNITHLNRNRAPLEHLPINRKPIFPFPKCFQNFESPLITSQWN